MIGVEHRAAAESPALARPGVRAEDQNVFRLRVQVNGLAAQHPRDVHLMQVRVQVPVDEVRAKRAYDHDGGQGRR